MTGFERCVAIGLRRQTLDTKRVKEPSYFNELYSQQFRIEPDKYTMMVLNSADGSEYDSSKAARLVHRGIERPRPPRGSV